MGINIDLVKIRKQEAVAYFPWWVSTDRKKKRNSERRRNQGEREPKRDREWEIQRDELRQRATEIQSNRETEKTGHRGSEQQQPLLRFWLQNPPLLAVADGGSKGGRSTAPEVQEITAGGDLMVFLSHGFQFIKV